MGTYEWERVWSHPGKGSRSPLVCLPPCCIETTKNAQQPSINSPPKCSLTYIYFSSSITNQIKINQPRPSPSSLKYLPRIFGFHFTYSYIHIESSLPLQFPRILLQPLDLLIVQTVRFVNIVHPIVYIPERSKV
jgi:hypothetical protein